MKRVPPATTGDSTAERIANAPTVEELEEMRPPWEEHFDGGEDVVRWYNTAPFTAARIFVRACEQSKEFHELFVNDLERPIETADGHVVEVAAWRKVLREELPELHDQLNSIELSAAQGGFAENMAREVLQ